jgi:hypothetical protein
MRPYDFNEKSKVLEPLKRVGENVWSPERGL